MADSKQRVAAVDDAILSKSRQTQALAAQPPGAPRPAELNFVAVDACVRLMVGLVQQHGGRQALFAKVLGIMAVVLQRWEGGRGYRTGLGVTPPSSFVI